jgi:peptidoglycan/xylan/chitin deacetylase (PgdA/CDA1 family)
VRLCTGLPVLLYHHVGPERPGLARWLTVSPERFAEHMAWLTRHRYWTPSIHDVMAWLDRERALPARSVLITFDDGHADLAEHAFPVLERAGLTAVTFLVSARIGGTDSWDEGGVHPLLDAQAVREWSGRGQAFGAHSRTHPHLGALSAAARREEILGSRTDLEALLGEPVSTFAYPYESPDSVSAAIAGEAFELAFTIQEGLTHGRSERHRLRRTMVQSGDGRAALAQRVALGRSPTTLARQRLGELRRRYSPSRRA